MIRLLTFLTILLAASTATANETILYPEDSPIAPKDCSGDWAPAFNERLRYEREPGIVYGDEPLIELRIGRDCAEYSVHAPIHVFGARIKGERQGARIRCVDVPGGCVRGHYPDTSVGPGTYQDASDPYAGSAGPLRIEDLTIRGTRMPGSIGIAPRWGFTAKHVLVERFDVGVDLTCTARPTPPETPANCNRFLMEFVTAAGNLSDGFRLKGADVNQGTAIGIDARVNGGWGWWSDSFLGNTLIAPHFAGNAEGAIYVAGVSARTVVLGLYVENDLPPGDRVDVRFPSVVLQATGGRLTPETKSIREGRVYGGLDFIDDAGQSTHRLGGEPNTYAAMGQQGDPHPVRFKHVAGIGWSIDHANLGSRQAMIVTTNTSPSHLPRGRAWFRNGALHGPTALREFYVAGAEQLPSPVGLPLGSRAWSTAPNAGEPALWIVSTSSVGVKWAAQ